VQGVTQIPSPLRLLGCGGTSTGPRADADRSVEDTGCFTSARLEQPMRTNFKSQERSFPVSTLRAVLLGKPACDYSAFSVGLERPIPTDERQS